MTNLNNELSVDELEAVSGGADALNIDLGLVKIKAVSTASARLRCAVFWRKQNSLRRWMPKVIAAKAL